MRSDTKVSIARKLPLLFLTLRNPLCTISMVPVKNRIDRSTDKQQRNNVTQRTRKRVSCRERWMKKYYNLSLLGWLTKPLSPLQSEESDDEPISSSPPPNRLPQNLRVESEPGSIQLTETPNDSQFAVSSIQLFTETVIPQVEPDNLALILPAEESCDQLPSHLPNMIQRVRQSKLCIDPKNFVVPFTPIIIEERLAGTNEVHTTVINTCGMTSLPYTLHDDDPFDTKYPNPKTLLPPISVFLNFRRVRRS
ncbi:hypothetical protein WUBG_00315 [Wuchereria bancrofti]|uniref:Uncharacterized protein n=2 Tax=Wuchereria bancrofti TaxID=6293 RepID=J9F1K2_WUCBA|nr:hypothetical protein WUBG_00315 [Wuchereria bancrofti]VDM09278.1 unnamed protein product [Wuchereria bancrofti]